MRIVGEWQVGDDGVTRSIIRAGVQAAYGTGRRRGEVLLLAFNHQFRVKQP
jgi:hypothetical protein